jgi:peptide chain release factor 1
MKESLIKKLEQMSERLEELNALLAQNDVASDINKYKKLSIEHSQLQPIVTTFIAYQENQESLISAKEMLNDPELKEMAQDEITQANKEVIRLADELQILLLPKDPNDNRNIFLEIRAGTGGDEASIFSGDLFRMYSYYAEQHKWQVEIINSNEGDHGGFKEIITKISGVDVYAKLKFESGAHRVQRIPETESQGRVHTSACTVAVMPEVTNITEVNIDMKDVRVDTFRASGAGGQHVNKTDSAIRVTHIPTGVVVECQDGRSQHKNKEKALSVLASRILDAQQQKQKDEQDSTRKNLVGSGDRSQRIRTYNYPQGRVTDHRINLTLYKLADIMNGDLSAIIKPLILEQQTNQLADLND